MTNSPSVWLVSGQRLASDGLERHVRPVRPGDIAARQEASVGHESETPDFESALERDSLLSGFVVFYLLVFFSYDPKKKIHTKYNEHEIRCTLQFFFFFF